jgi:3'-phosphoadenosine 5'-phosphosulfate sulfotransferase (PAPS reductase)/FAD synthetase
VTEAEAQTLCEKSGLLSPIYAHCRRNGCWFCPNASDEELLHMITKHPELFDRLIEWEKEDNIFHRRLTRRETPSEIKARLMSKPQPGLSSNKNQG